MIRFSIITVCLNAGEDLISTVTDTLCQTYENFEIIVKDGFPPTARQKSFLPTTGFAWCERRIRAFTMP